MLCSVFCQCICVLALVKIFDHTRFFYKNKLYMNTQAEICPKIKNNLRTITRLKFDLTNLRSLFNPFAQIEMYMYTKTRLN